MSNKQKLSRRKIILQGSIGLAGIGSAIASVGKAQANTQKPVAPASGKANSNGRFKDKVVLIPDFSQRHKKRGQ